MDQSSSGSRNPARKSIRCKEGNGDLKASGLIRGHSNPKWIRSREGAYLVLGIELLLELGDFSLLGGWEVLRIVPAHRFRPAACLPFFLFSTGREGGGNRREEREANGWLLVCVGEELAFAWAVVGQVDRADRERGSTLSRRVHLGLSILQRRRGSQVRQLLDDMTKLVIVECVGKREWIDWSNQFLDNPHNNQSGYIELIRFYTIMKDYLFVHKLNIFIIYLRSYLHQSIMKLLGKKLYRSSLVWLPYHMCLCL